MPDTDWPFGTDAVRDDPLTNLRIPVVTSFNPTWRYVAAYLGTSADTGNTFDPPWPFASSQRPTDAEAQMLVSFLQEHRHYWFNNQGYAQKMDARPSTSTADGTPRSSSSTVPTTGATAAAHGSTGRRSCPVRPSPTADRQPVR